MDAFMLFSCHIHDAMLDAMLLRAIIAMMLPCHTLRCFIDMLLMLLP